MTNRAREEADMRTQMSHPFYPAFVAFVLMVPSLSAHAQSEKPEMTDMQFIEGGTFRMGDVLDEGLPLATPVHDVTLSGFYLNKHEVTVEEFSAFVGNSEYVTSAEIGATCETPTGTNTPKSADEHNARLACPGAWVLDTPSKGAWKAEANWKNPHFGQGPSDPVVACPGGTP